MIELGFNLVTITSDFRAMTTFAQNIINEMKEKNINKSESGTY